VELNNKLEQVKSSKKAPTNLAFHLDRLKLIYENFLNCCGSLPCPVLLKCGEGQIASRIVPYGLWRMYASDSFIAFKKLFLIVFFFFPSADHV
jgi:hypothetical protein